jgi:8-amino-7-oxononanoate synthase
MRSKSKAQPMCANDITATLDAQLTHVLDERATQGLLRTRRTVTWRSAVECDVDGRACVAFCSNDYLGFAHDPATHAAAAEALATYGTGAGASRLISGEYPLVRELEQRLAAFKQVAAALVFPSGYMANLGVITALAGPRDRVVIDRLAHASLVDGARLSRAQLRVFPHNDVAALDRILAQPQAGRTLVATESVFSMDGDCAPLAELVECCAAHAAILVVDEAHALGVYGDGRGLVVARGLAARVPVVVGTLSKALGSQGGFAAGSHLLVEYLFNAARAFVYTTGIMPAAAGAALAAVRALEQATGRVTRLWRNTQQVRAGLVAARVPGNGPICPLLVGTAQAAVAAATSLRDAGLLVPAVRPPTVPVGTARLRISISAAHTEAQCAALLRALHSLPATR